MRTINKKRMYNNYIFMYFIYMYIECITFSGTTEKIFETKTHLYDVYVDNQCVRTPSPHLRELLKTSQADRDKLTKLNNQR